MSDEPVGTVEGALSKGVSRRAALRAGAAAGIGVAAWSGASITSLGGTPAYAVGCTFVIRITLEGCRNTDQGNCAGNFRYHPLTSDVTGYTLSNNVPNGTCCLDNWVTTLNFPTPGITCKAEIRFREPPNCTGTAHGTFPLGPEEGSSDGSLEMVLECPTVIPSNSQYSIVATCTTTGAPEECFN